MRRWIYLTAALFVAGCGGDSSTGPSENGPSLSVSLMAPADGSMVSGSITIAATAEGAERAVFTIDGDDVGTDSASPYRYSRDTTQFANGQHHLADRPRIPRRPSRTGSR
jgi:hypothetical protein